MPQKAVVRVNSVPRRAPFDPNQRSIYSALNGVVNKPEWPSRVPESPMELNQINALGCQAWRTSWAWSGYIALDAPNMRSYYYAYISPWDERLYATVYTKFVQAARQGSAEWGMNIRQGRKALDTFVQLALTSATTVAMFTRANRIGLEWLKRHRDSTPASVGKLRKKRGRDLVRAREASERRRLSNEIWTLDQVSGTLLAYRYGVAPLMADLFSTAEILSKDFEDNVSLRKSGRVPWNGTNSAWDDKWMGHESVVLKATVSVSNPNLLLANRLGLTNPQYWAWDSTPWSFAVDWWLPVGDFLQNFTASVGLNFLSASVTRTRSYAGTWQLVADEVTFVPQGDMRFFGKRKVRTTGSLPIPLSVPYGTGLGIQRGQNALALIAQQLTKR